MKKTISLLFKDLCCSRCKSDFAQESITQIQQEGEYYAVNLTCKICGKDFGTVFLKLTKNNSNKLDEIILKDSRDIPPINYDDVLDAHVYIKDIEKNLRRFLED